MSIPAFIESTEGLVAAFAGLMSGLAALLTALGQFTAAKRKPSQAGRTMVSTHTYKSPLAVAGICLVLASGGVFVVRAFSPTVQGLNVELTTAAWNAFNKGDFVGAIANADKCISEFRAAADRQQADLENSKTPLPPTGAVDEAVAKTIHSRGLLNDVATCFYIKGRASDNVGRSDEARQAYQSATKYTYARCWDPKGWFWSPAEASSDRLRTLK